MTTLTHRKSNPLAAVAAACLLVLVLAGCGSKEDKVAKFMARGQKLMEAGAVDKAVLEYKNAIQIDPKATAPRLAIGTVSYTHLTLPTIYSV